MASPTFYRTQARRCLLLARAMTDPEMQQRCSDIACYYAAKANATDLCKASATPPEETGQRPRPLRWSRRDTGGISGP
jgi:hypothetical protein